MTETELRQGLACCSDERAALINALLDAVRASDTKQMIYMLLMLSELLTSRPRQDLSWGQHTLIPEAHHKASHVYKSAQN